MVWMCFLINAWYCESTDWIMYCFHCKNYIHIIEVVIQIFQHIRDPLMHVRICIIQGNCYPLHLELYPHDRSCHSDFSTYQASSNARQNLHYTRQLLSLASSHAWNLLDSTELGLLRLTPPTASWYGAFNKSLWGTSDMNDKWYMACLKKCAIFGFL